MPWPPMLWSSKTKEGVSIGDVERDGRIGLVRGGWWIKNRMSWAGAWTSYQFATGYDVRTYPTVIGDLNGDSRRNTVVDEQHNRYE